MKEKIELRLGALSPKIKDQLPQLKAKDASRFQKISDSVTMLHLHGYLSESEMKKKRDKIFKEIMKVLYNEK